MQNPPDNAEELGSIPGPGRSPGNRKWQLIPVFLPAKPHGQRIRWAMVRMAAKESDVTQRLNYNKHRQAQGAGPGS